MIRNVMTDMGMTLGPTVALLVFVAMFILVLLWIFRPGSRKTYEEESQLPLDDGTANRGSQTSPGSTASSSDAGERPHAET